MHAIAVQAALSVVAMASEGTITVVQSSEAGDQWKALPPLAWGPDFGGAAVAVDMNVTRQIVMGFGAAMTDTSAYNAMVWMNPDVRDRFFEALWGRTGLGLSLGRVTLNSADFSYETFNYDGVRDDFELAHFDHTLA